MKSLKRNREKRWKNGKKERNYRDQEGQEKDRRGGEKIERITGSLSRQQEAKL